MIRMRFRIGLRTFLSCVAICAVCMSIVTREAKRQRGWITPGDILIVEVLEAVPGHPITGNRLVRSDGTIDLDYYGKLSVNNLTRDELKIALIRRLRGFLTDETLGLANMDTRCDCENEDCESAEWLKCDRVFVDCESSYGFSKYKSKTLDYLNCMLGCNPDYWVVRPRRGCCPTSSNQCDAP